MGKSKDDINKRRRELYAQKRGAGLSRSESRATKKAIETNPNLLTSLAGIFRGVVKDIQTTLDTTSKELLKPEKKSKAKNAPKNSPKKTRTQKPRDDFKSFVAKNPNKSTRVLIDTYRALGHRIGNERGKEIIREVYGREKNLSKRNRVKYYKNDKAPSKKHYIKDKYVYVVKYSIDTPDGKKDKHITIASNRKMGKRAIMEELDAMFEDSPNYAPDDIVGGSIEILYGVERGDTF